jgi:hypothetical protein
MLRARKRATGMTRAGACAPALIVATAFIVGCGGGSGKARASVTVTAPSQSAIQPAPSADAPASSTSQSAAAGSPSSSSRAKGAPAATGTIAGADAICARRNRELAAISGSGASADATGGAESQRVAIERRALGELAKLKPPASVLLGYQRVLIYSEVMLQRAEQLSKSPTATDAKGTPLAKAAIKGQLRLLAAAGRAGLKDCYPVD